MAWHRQLGSANYQQLFELVFVWDQLEFNHPDKGSPQRLLDGSNELPP